MRWRALLVAALLGALLAWACRPATARAGLCERFGAMAKAGTVADDGLVELSGVAASRRHAGVLWAHNDSGGAAEVHALGIDGKALGVYPVPGAEATDWEDIAVGPGPGSGSYLFIGDIGDNGAERTSVTVYRVPEPAAAPAAPGAPLAGVAAIHLRYPKGPADAETLLVDPRSGDLVIVTKALSGISRVLVAPKASLQPGATVTMTDTGTITIPVASSGSGLPGTMVTGGDVSPDGSIVALRTYRSVLLFAREGGSVAAALEGQPCFGSQAPEPQGEAVAFTRDGAAIVTSSEGSHPPVYRSQPPAQTTPTTSRASTPTTAASGTGRSTTTASTSTTLDPSSTTGSSPTTTGRGDGRDADEGSAGEAQRPASSERDDGGLSPLLLLVPLAAVAGGTVLVLRRRRSATG